MIFLPQNLFEINYPCSNESEQSFIFDFNEDQDNYNLNNNYFNNLDIKTSLSSNHFLKRKRYIEHDFSSSLSDEKKENEENMQSFENNIFNNNIKEEEIENGKENNDNNYYFPNTIPEIQKRNCNKIFRLEKCYDIRNPKGRRKKDAKHKKEPQHTKFTEDNIITRIKKNTLQDVSLKINKELSLFYKEKFKEYELKKIKPNFANAKRKEEVLEYFSKKIKDVFSEELSERWKKIKDKETYNKKRIDKIIQENKAKDVINILNETLENMYNKYIGNEYSDCCLENNLKILEEKEGQNYRNKYEDIAKRLIEIINNKKSRKKKGINNNRN